MQSRQEVYNAAVRAHEIASLLVKVGNAYGDPCPVDRVMEWFDEMNGSDITDIESGLIRLTQDLDEDGKGCGYYTIYVNVGPSKDKREDLRDEVCD